ncbi:MAG: hypothetical protein GFH25_541272n43 [Chloroflexi bacterium AL-N10]|nr:hypothetical protein [Chloroflexi bacterium AL-N10]NOK87102.1 hypothetical protein [Chloroflexi bacterium AL-N15]
MLLDRIVVENFRQYFGRHRINFARDTQHRVTVIHGVNGAGKTSLFLAINWCLYGKSVDNVTIVDNVGELMSKEALSRVAPNDRLMASVELSFFHGGDRYIARRVLRASKQTDGNLLLDNGDYFTLMRTRPDGQAESIPNPIGTINAILPSNVRTYFLFDGEKIDNFAKPESAKEVKDAIYLVLKLEILDRARRHLESAAQDYRRELKKVSSGELRTFIEREEQAIEEQRRDASRKGDLLKEIESARSKIVEIDQHLRETQNARALQEQRDAIEQELRQLRSEQESIISQIRDLATSGYFAIAQPAVDEALRILDEKRERGEIPSNIRQQFVQDLLAQMRCICGRAITDDSPEHQHLLALIKKGLPGSLENDVLDTSAALRPFGERVERRRSDLHTMMQHRTGLVDAINRLEAELSDIRRQLQGSPIEEISRLEKQREDFLADIDSANLEIGAIDERGRKLAKELAQLRKDIEKARTKEKRERLLSTKLSLAQHSVEAIEHIYQTFADDMRLRIEAKTKEIFKQLTWKGDHFEDVRLSPEYNLEIIDRYGLARTPRALGWRAPSVESIVYHGHVTYQRRGSTAGDGYTVWTTLVTTPQ